jgi:hypothetical protein
MGLGLAAAWTRAPAPQLTPPTPTGRDAAVLAAGLAIVLSIPLRAVSRAADLDLTHAAFGVSRWSPGDTPPRTRTVGRRARFYVPAAATGAAFDLRRSDETTAVVSVDVYFDGTLVIRIVLDDDTWRPVVLAIPDRPPRFHEVEIRVASPASAARDAEVDAGVVMSWIRTAPRAP